MTASSDAPGPGRAADRRSHPAPGRWFWPCVAAGWSGIAVGLWGLVADASATRPPEAVRFVIGLAAAHDLVVAPAVVVAGWLVARALPPLVRGPAQAALVVSATVALFSVPFVRGDGRVATNPSILPRDYGAGLALVLVVTWAAAGVAVALRWRRRRR